MLLSYHYVFSVEKIFEEAVTSLAMSAFKDFEKVVRLVFFGRPSGEEEFHVQRTYIGALLRRVFNGKIPAYTYVAQPLLCSGRWALEVQTLEGSADVRCMYLDYASFPYVKVESEDCRFLFLSAISYSDISSPIDIQAAGILRLLADIIKKENLEITDIVRQWNYIDHITGREPVGHQRYQDFNDVRSLFYGHAFDVGGYPAATGIGTQCGGLQIEADVLKDARIFSSRIDNPCQQAAYRYSSQVLVGGVGITTPKFERARSVTLLGSGWVYISGTAAIRGEDTVEADAFVQAELTLENIRTLLQRDTLLEYGIAGEACLKSIRVYVKKKEDIQSVKKCVETNFPELEVVYVQADVCRDNLLVEMEGVAHLAL